MTSLKIELWAAIDLLEGKVVTLVQGRASERTVWKEGPEKVAKRWEEEGADGLHLIDLDAALERGSSNRDILLRIIGAAGVPVQLGGGMRTLEAASGWLGAGVRRVVVGTMAYREPEALAELLKTHGPERIVVAADYDSAGIVVTRGWRESQGIGVVEAATRLQEAGVRNILTTSVGRDGMRSGPDVEMVRRICGATGMSVMASGGIRNADDLAALEGAGAGGAILGRALYEETVHLAEAKRGTGGAT
jgi:phosphoribosylformimino-5-aminoimidazole carboxamide ribotide isomerase